MKITFPHIGDAHLIGRIFFNEIGIEIITPSPNTMSGLERGSGVCPDEICIPFKLMAENLMEAHQKGADTVIMPATMGPCRLGEYAELLKSILDKRGYPFRWILLDSTLAIGKRELVRRLAQVVSDCQMSKPAILRALQRTYRVLKKLELLEQRAHILAGYEVEKGSCKRLLAACRKGLAEAGNTSTALRIIRSHLCDLEEVRVDFSREPLKVLLTGEIFSMIEPFANHHIEELLMDMGISFQKRVTLGWWINRTIINPYRTKGLFERHNPYLPYAIGGYARETVGEGVRCNKKGYDGIIQVFPVGCMPEIVAKAVFSRMMKEKSLHILTVIYDEMDGETGYITRVEAFIDMLDRRKKTIKHRGKANVLSGH